ncbi:MAG: RHS repeat-associated core domain-containing protein [Phycisphaera sp. RhM]|nr:RHS repeat-associated core domain-containing protein [Phycisphaera sp. RhM]
MFCHRSSRRQNLRQRLARTRARGVKPCADSKQRRSCKTLRHPTCSPGKSRPKNDASSIKFTVRYLRTNQYSITALTDSSGTIKERYAYDAYGGLSVFDGGGVARTSTAEGNRYTYTGREWDKVLSLFHYRARMYDPSSGRFLGRDPIGFEGSEWDLYQYADGSPRSVVDPSGKLPWYPLSFFACVSCLGPGAIACGTDTDCLSYYFSLLGRTRQTVCAGSCAAFGIGTAVKSWKVVAPALALGRKQLPKIAKKCQEVRRKTRNNKRFRRVKDQAKCLAKCALHFTACTLSNMDSMPELPGRHTPFTRCEGCNNKCIAICKGGGTAERNRYHPWPGRTWPATPPHNYGSCAYWNSRGGAVPPELLN